MTDKTGNIQQRVFDAIPGEPLSISTSSIYSLLPFAPRSIQSALTELQAQRLVEKIARFTYRRVDGAQRPTDKRGGLHNPGGRNGRNG